MTTEIREIDTPYGTRWTVHRDGHPVPRRNERGLDSIEAATDWASIIAQLPNGYTTEWHKPRANAMDTTVGWFIVGPGNYRSIKITDEAQLVPVAQQAAQDETTRTERDNVRAAAQKAEAAAKAAREQAARAAQERQDAGLATPNQVDYILTLLDRRDGAGGGFMVGPTRRAGIEQLTRTEASAYITSLREEY